MKNFEVRYFCEITKSSRTTRVKSDNKTNARKKFKEMYRVTLRILSVTPID